MNRPQRYAAQALFYGLFFIPLVYLTSAPLYQYQAPGLATLKIAIRHAGKIVGECVDIAPTSQAHLPPNMKLPQSCPRERSPLHLQLLVDGEALYHATVPASGLHSDGVSSMYQRFDLPAGKHSLELIMNDDVSIEGPIWQLQRDIDLVPAQVMVASFKGGFQLQ